MTKPTNEEKGKNTLNVTIPPREELLLSDFCFQLLKDVVSSMKNDSVLNYEQKDRKDAERSFQES